MITPEFSTSAADVFNARLAQAYLITKTILMLNCQVFIEKLPQINQYVCLLKMNWKSQKTFDSSYFRGKSHFVDNDGTENYLVFQPIRRYFKLIANTKYISVTYMEVT